MKAIDRFYEYLAEKSLKPTAIEKMIGVSNGYLSAQKKRSADMGEGMLLKIIDYFRDINPLWLLTGEGSMFRDNPIQQPIISTSSDSITLRLMDKLDEKDLLLKEKEFKIDQLQSELRTMTKELATIKTKFAQYEPQPEASTNNSKGLDHAKNASTKNTSSPNADNVTSATVP